MGGLQKSLQSADFGGHRGTERVRKSKKIIGSSSRTRIVNLTYFQEHAGQRMTLQTMQSSQNPINRAQNPGRARTERSNPNDTESATGIALGIIAASHTPPEWFTLANDTITRVLERIASETDNLNLAIQVRFMPKQAFCFLVNFMLLANRANREGMHANAFAIIRQCLEAATGSLGLSQRSEDRLQAARQADRQCFRGIVQWHLPRRVPGHELVPDLGRSQADHHRLEIRIQ